MGHIAAGLVVGMLTLAVAAPALADHTNPKRPLAQTHGPDAEGMAQGLGQWTFIRNFPPNPGTDLEFWRRGGKTFASSGTLGQANVQHVGQRILRLVNRRGRVKPRWFYDHGSANCPTANPAGTTGLQHDAQVTPRHHAKLIVDTTDALGRCHDPDGGGIELIDISGVGKKPRKKFAPREIGLTRHDGTTHNATVDRTRPWIVYSSNTDTGRPWIDVVNVKSCLLPDRASLKRQRRHCRPKVYRMPFPPDTTNQVNQDPRDGDVGQLENNDDTVGGNNGCHDITAARNRLYCAAINGTAIINVKRLTTKKGRVRGQPLPCKVVTGTNTTAKVTDCDLGNGHETAEEDRQLYAKIGRPAARGWRVVGTVHHPGREDANTNQFVRADEGVAVSHEADGLHRRFMFVTDERGGGVQPPGASCSTGLDNPIGNGGLHVFDITNPANPHYALKPDGSKAIFISDRVTPVPTFCNIHVIEKIRGEQRLIMAWYSQGIKILDWFIDSNGRWTFDEVASYTLPNANTWVVQDFKRSKRHDDGTRTYWFMTSDIDRGIDIVKWRGPMNRRGERAPAQQTTQSGTNVGLVIAGLTLLPGAAVIGRRRRRSRAIPR